VLYEDMVSRCAVRNNRQHEQSVVASAGIVNDVAVISASLKFQAVIFCGNLVRYCGRTALLKGTGCEDSLHAWIFSG
jgi:hypothetical protein